MAHFLLVLVSIGCTVMTVRETEEFCAVLFTIIIEMRREKLVLLKRIIL